MRNALIIVAAAVTLVSQVSGQEPNPMQTPAPKKIEITFEGNGVMSLSAANAPVRDILAEWTRKGGTPFPGAERLTGAPLTLEFPHKAETEVIASLLRGASGYIVRDRLTPSTSPSNIEVVYVLATSTATSSGFSPAPAYVPQPQPTTQGNPDNEIQPVGPGRGGQATNPPYPDAPPPPRPAGVTGVAVPVIVVPVSSSAPPTPTPTGTPPTTTGTGPGRGGGGGR